MRKSLNHTHSLARMHYTSQSKPGDVRWMTEGQVYGEDTVPLIRLVDPRFYHPKTVTEITKKYGTSLKTKEK